MLQLRGALESELGYLVHDHIEHSIVLILS